jgi:hypothetical protein
MAGLKDISSIWNNIKEVDLKPIRDSAVHPLRIAIIGAPGSGRHTLAEQMRTDPSREGIHTQSAVAISTLDAALPIAGSDLIIMMVDASRGNFSEELASVQKLSEAGKNVLVFINKIELVSGASPLDVGQVWMASKVLLGSANDNGYLQMEFVPVVLEMLPSQHIALGRQFPLFRLTIAHQLINETCFSNAAYSFSTGVAEIVPVLDLPLNLTDLIVLTKSQAFLAYKLGLLIGFSTRWQDYVTEFGGVIGGGFVWRQAARSLVGLVPGWGIIPKVAIAYSGTYVVGHAILGWYLSGRHLSASELRALSVKAFSRGKEYGRKLSERLPKGKPGKRKQEKTAALQQPPEGLPEFTSQSANEVVIEINDVSTAGMSQPEGNANLVARPNESSSLYARVEKVMKLRKTRPSRVNRGRRHKAEDNAENIISHVCPKCGKTSSADAVFCQYCGVPFDSTI